MFCPIIWVFSGSFKDLAEFTTSPGIIPKKPTLENFFIFLTIQIISFISEILFC
jgi:ABC-type glycerol-3-phosphate transport system permease component